MPEEASEEGEKEEEEEENILEDILQKIIDAIASFYEMLGVSEEDAKEYAAWTFWIMVALVVIVAGLKLYKLIRGY